jgi:hypothetical protein
VQQRKAARRNQRPVVQAPELSATERQQVLVTVEQWLRDVPHER